MLREEDFAAWLHNVNNPKGLNTLKNNMRRKTRIFNVSVLILWSLDARILTLNSPTYITCRFVFLLRITFLALQFLKQFSFVFIFLLRWIELELIHPNINKNMKTKEMKDETHCFLKIFFQYTHIFLWETSERA